MRYLTFGGYQILESQFNEIFNRELVKLRKAGKQPTLWLSRNIIKYYGEPITTDR